MLCMPSSDPRSNLESLSLLGLDLGFLWNKVHSLGMRRQSSLVFLDPLLGFGSDFGLIESTRNWDLYFVQG